MGKLKTCRRRSLSLSLSLSLANRAYRRKPQKNNKGMGLIQVMVAGAILAGLGLFMAQMANQSTKISKGSKNSMDIAGKFAQIQNALFKGDVCQDFLKDQKLGPIPGTSMLRKGKKLSGTSFSTKSLDFIKEDSKYYIKAVFKKDSRDQSFGTAEVVRKFAVSVNFKEDGVTVEDCFSDVKNAIQTAITRSCRGIGGQIKGGNCELLQETKEKIVTDAVKEKRVVVYKDSKGRLTLEKKDGIDTKVLMNGPLCGRWPPYPKCDAGWVEQETWERDPYVFPKCPAGTYRRRYTRCKFYPKPIGFLVALEEQSVGNEEESSGGGAGGPIHYENGEYGDNNGNPKGDDDDGSHNYMHLEESD